MFKTPSVLSASSKSDMTPETSPEYILDYASKEDLPDFLLSVQKESAMAEIYFEDENEVLSEETVKLFENAGRLRHKGINRCDLMLVLRDNNKLIGYIELKLLNNDNIISQLYGLYVSDQYRRQGLGNLLMVYALGFFVNTGKLTMTVSPTADSLALYNKFGFYPPDKDNNELTAWFKMNDDARQLNNCRTNPPII